MMTENCEREWGLKMKWCKSNELSIKRGRWKRDMIRGMLIGKKEVGGIYECDDSL